MELYPPPPPDPLRKHLDVLEGTVAVMRRTIDNLAGEFMDTAAGKAAARLRGLTAMVCFGRRRSSRHDQAKETVKEWKEDERVYFS